MNLISKIIKIFFFLIGAASVSLDIFANSLEKCIGGYCIGATTTKTYADVTRETSSHGRANLGAGTLARTICLHDSISGRYLVLGFSGDGDVKKYRIDSLFLKNEKICDKNYGKSFSIKFTNRGLSLGSSIKDIEKVLGNPSRIDDAVVRERENPLYLTDYYASRFGFQRFHFDEAKNSLLINQFGVNRAGKIVSILISISP